MAPQTLFGAVNSPIYGKDKKGLYWLQTMSSWEEVLKSHAKALTGSTESKDWLETCGPHAAVNCMTAVLSDPDSIDSERNWGSQKTRVPDKLMAVLENPRNRPVWEKALGKLDWDAVFENEFAAIYPSAVEIALGFKGALFLNKPTWELVVQYIKNQGAVQLTLLKPAHYIAVTGYDAKADQLSYVDSNDRPHADGNWYDCRLTRAQFESNTRPWCVVYPRPTA